MPADDAEELLWRTGYTFSALYDRRADVFVVHAYRLQDRERDGTPIFVAVAIGHDASLRIAREKAVQSVRESLR